MVMKLIKQSRMWRRKYSLEKHKAKDQHYAYWYIYDVTTIKVQATPYKFRTRREARQWFVQNLAGVKMKHEIRTETLYRVYTNGSYVAEFKTITKARQYKSKLPRFV